MERCRKEITNFSVKLTFREVHCCCCCCGGAPRFNPLNRCRSASANLRRSAGANNLGARKTLEDIA